MKISLLIPVFDYDIVALVHSMKNALGKFLNFVKFLLVMMVLQLNSEKNTDHLKEKMSE